LTLPDFPRTLFRTAKKTAAKSVAAVCDRRSQDDNPPRRSQTAATIARPSSLLDTRVVYCGDNLEQLAKLPDACVDLIYIDPPAWPKPLRRGEGPRCVQLARVLKKTGSFYYHCDWHASHYVSHGAQLGQLVSKINPVFGAANYTYRLTANTPGAVPVIEQDTASTHTFSSLIAGVNYKLEVSALGTAGPSDWSNPASLTAD
jgi:hypothetical protein